MDKGEAERIAQDMERLAAGVLADGARRPWPTYWHDGKPLLHCVAIVDSRGLAGIWYESESVIVRGEAVALIAETGVE